MGQPYYKERFETQKMRQHLSPNRTYHCEDCGKDIYVNHSIRSGDRLVLHHVKPIVRGGITIKQNIAKLCDSCHGIRHRLLNKTPELPLFHVSPEAQEVTRSSGLEVLQSIRDLLGQSPRPVKVKVSLAETLSRIEALLKMTPRQRQLRK